MKNWKTTTAGLLVALAYGLQNYNGANTWQGYAVCFFLAAGGFFSKDYNTHSTEAQVQTATDDAKVATLAAVNK